MTGSEILVVALAVAAGAALKSVTGMGLPLLAIPVISAVAPVKEAVAVVALPNLPVNVTLLERERAPAP